MDVVFPIGFPGPTAFYLSLYVLTLVVHVVFMNYVLAGSAYLAVASVFTGGPSVQRQKTPTALLLRDWMPFAISAAITAGVAPLLFIQILYKKAFYSANLLLFHRWMAILPVLIVGFYLAYVLKSKKIGHWPAPVRALVGIGAFLCFAFTAYSWTENHLLSTEAGAWPTLYGSGSLVYDHPQLIPRLALWFFGGFPTLAVLIGWQLRAAQRRGEDILPVESRRITAIACAGLLLSAIAAAIYYWTMDAAGRAAPMSPMARPYLALGVVGLLVQGIGWVRQWRSAEIQKAALMLSTIGVLLTVVGMTVVREALRITAIDLESLYAQHAAAAGIGGLSAFLAFFLINALAIIWCVRLVRRQFLARAA